MAEEMVTPEQLIYKIRSTLAERGSVGQWLLSKIDEARLSGLEDKEDHLFKEGNAFVYRPPKNEWETLHLYLDVLEAYMVTLPACFESAERTLQEQFGVKNVKLSMRAEMAPDVMLDQDHEPLYSGKDMFTSSSEHNQELFKGIGVCPWLEQKVGIGRYPKRARFV